MEAKIFLKNFFFFFFLGKYVLTRKLRQGGKIFLTNAENM